MRGKEFGTPKPDKDKQEKDESVVQLLVKFANENIKKFVVSAADSSIVFGVIKINEHVEARDILGYKTLMWLKDAYDLENNNIFSDDSYKSALSRLAARAMHNDSSREVIFNRVAMIGDTIYYDLTTNDWKIVKIKDSKWEVINYDETLPIFERKQHQQSQVIPKTGNLEVLDRLCDWLRIQQKDRFMFKIHLVSLFLEKYPMPIMVLTGEQGSIKTTITKTVKRIIDPSSMLSAAIPKSNDDLTIHLNNRYVSAFDNVSGFNHEVSDVFCRAITGEGVSKRALYTNTEETILSYVRKIILNGISPSLEFPDFRERAIFYQTMAIEEKDRLTLKEFDNAINEILGEVLGAIFDVLAKAISLYAIVENQIEYKPRMSDFAVWGEAISQGLGNEKELFINYYRERLQADSLEAINNYPIFGLVQKMMENRDVYEDSVSAFYQILCSYAEDVGINIKSKYVKFPQAPNKIRWHIVTLRTNFRTVGLEIVLYTYTLNDRKYTKGTQIIKISKTSYTTELSLPSSPSSPLGRLGVNLLNFGEDTPDQVSSPSSPVLEDNNTMGGEGTLLKGEDKQNNILTEQSPKLSLNEPKEAKIKSGEDSKDGEDKTHILKDSDYWATPKYLFNEICLKHNVKPKLDVCATKENRKCDQFISEEQNALKQDWIADCWCNPPYSQTKEWVKKCYFEHKKNNITVTALIMYDPSTKYFRDFIKGKAEVHELTGRVRFIDPETNSPGDAARFASAVIIWRSEK